MKANLLKLLLATTMLVGIVACGSSQPMTPDEAATWIAAYTPECVDRSATIRIEPTDSLRVHINTMCTLDKVFSFEPSVDGVASFSDDGRYIDFKPNEGELEQGVTYECRVNLAELTTIGSMRDFAFQFYVERRESKFDGVEVVVDPDNEQQAIVTGYILFNLPPSNVLENVSLLTCDDKAAVASISPTDDERCYEFKLSGIKRGSSDKKLKIKYSPLAEFSKSKCEVEVPGLEDFRVISAERKDAVEPYINVEFSAPLATDQELDGLITIDDIANVRIESSGTNVKVFYPQNSLVTMTMRISELLRDSRGRRLSKDVEQTFAQEILPPAVEVPISGTILPDGNNLKLPFRAVNLAAVDVEVVKIYADNVITFLQENEINSSNRLRRFGRLIYRQTVRLDKDKSLNLHQWQNFSIDLKNLFRQERGAIYNIRITFRKEYSLYGRDSADDFTPVSGVTQEDNAEWDKPEAYTPSSEYDWEYYDWQDSDDPTLDSYYMSTRRMPEYNLIASNLGLVVKRADTDRVWTIVTDIMTTRPLAGIRVVAYNYQMQEIGSAITNAQGFADFKVSGKPFVVVASNSISATYLKVNGGHELSLSTFDVGGKVLTQGVKGFVYGERGVWRPGDDIYLTLIVEDKQRALPKNHPVTMELYTPEEQLYESITLTKNVNGIYTFHTKTRDDAPTGHWNAQFKVGGQTFHHQVRIETIKPNRLKIKIDAPKTLYVDTEAEIGVESHWLTGPAASGLATSMEMALYNDPRPFEAYPKYVFSNPLYTFSNESVDYIYRAELDSLGRYTHQYTFTETYNAPGILQANLVARVFESGGDESLSSELVRFSPYKSYVGISLKDKAFETDANIEFPIVTLDPDGKAVNRELSYKIYRLTWGWWYEGSTMELCEYVQSSSAEVIKEGALTTVNGKAKLPMRIEYPAYGRYLIYVEDTESGHVTGGIVSVDWPEWRGNSKKEDPTAATMLSFSLNKKNYNVGEHATVYLPKSPGGRVLLSVENGSSVIARYWVETSPNKETQYRIPVTQNMAPNFYVSAMLLQPHAQTINDLPIRLYGVQGATVTNKHTVLHPVIDVPSEIRPQQPFTVRVREQSGKPMSYTLAIVDEGLLDLTSYDTPKPWAAMNEREALGVKTWDVYGDVVAAYAGKFRSILSIGGGDPGEDYAASVGKKKRFNPVVKFLGPFTLNKGVNTHNITLPMYVGSVRVMVVAAHDGSYGSADKSMTVRSPLMLLTSLPRKLNCGDKVKMPVNVFAMKEGVKDVKVSVSIEGPLSCVGGNTQNVSFSGPSEKLVEFDLKCDAMTAGKAKVVVTAVGGGQKATETIWIDVENPLPDVITSESKVMVGEGEHTFTWKGFDNGRVLLTLSTLPAIDFNGAFSFVDNYSHYCSEQLSARAMYMLYARKFLNIEDQSKAEVALDTILKLLVSRQLSSGGFVYWPGDSDAHDWVSSMVGEVLTEARRQGFVVSNQCYDKWKEYQLSVARKYRHTSNHAEDLQQAYRLFTLVLAGEQPTALMNKLRESKSISRQALLRLAACYSLTGRADVATKLIERVDDTASVDGSYATFWSSLRDDAMALEAYAIIGDSERAFSMAEKVYKKFSATCCSTQDVAFVSAAMSRYVTHAADVCEVTIAEGSAKERVIRDLRGVKNIELNTKSATVTIRNKGSRNLYLSLMTARRPSVDETLAAENNGITLKVSYSTPVENLKQGTEIVAHINVKKSSSSSQYMALTFIGAAGWEIWNERLMGGGYDNGVNYVDVRDDRISWYFDAQKDKSLDFKVRLRAAYAGEYMLPSVICEDMYDPECRAITSNGKTKVE